MKRDAGRSVRYAIVLVLLAALAEVADASVKPRAVLIVPFDASTLERDEQWIGQGIAEVVGLGLDQHPAFVQIDDARVRAVGRPEVWGDAVVVQAARTLRADAAVFGRVTRSNAELIIQPRLLELKGTAAEPVSLEPIAVSPSELLARVAPLPVVYARTLKVPLTDAEVRRIDKAAQPARE